MEEKEEVARPFKDAKRTYFHPANRAVLDAWRYMQNLVFRNVT